MRHIVSLLFTFISAISTFGATYSVKGLVADSLGEPEAYATVRIYTPLDSIKPKALGTTDGNGVFNIALPSASDYNIHITSIGRAPIVREFTVGPSNPEANLGTLTVRTDGRELGEVTVTATRPLVTKEIDRIGYDVQADDESKTSTLEEMLRKVPMVSVDADGTIKVKGSSNFKIYKNGRPNNSFTKNAKEIFKAIPASMIKKIEVITDPGAREDAEGVGAVLNIVTMENTSMRGVTGNIGLNYTNKINAPMPNLWGSAQIDKVTLSLYGGMHQMTKRNTRNESESVTKYHDSGNTLISKSNGRNPGYITFFGIDGSYELDSLNLFTAEFGGYYYSIDVEQNATNTMLSPTGSSIYSYNSRSKSDPYSYFDINGSFNYQHSTHRKGEALTMSYMISTTNQRQSSTTLYSDMVNMPVGYTGIINDFKLNFIEHTLQFDWTRPIAEKHTLDLGAKYIYRDNNSRSKQNYIGFDDKPLLDFTHLTQVAAAYADYRVRLGKLNLRGGLRYEYSHLSAKYANGIEKPFSSNLSDWVPNAAISYDINDSNTLKVSWGTRINRPGISYLNPAVTTSPSATSQGNPDLGSARNNTFTLNYNFIGQKFNMDFTASYGFSDNDIVSVQHLENDHLFSTYENSGKNKSFNASAFLQWNISQKTNIMFNGSANYNKYQNPSLAIANDGWSGFAFTRLSQKLPWKLTTILGVSYWSGHRSLYSRTRGVGISQWDYFIGLQRSFLKEDRLTVRLNFTNPFYPSSSRYKKTNINLPYDSYTFSRDYGQCHQVGIQVSYRFGSMTAQVKKTAKSIENDDLTGRKLE